MASACVSERRYDGLQYPLAHGQDGDGIGGLRSSREGRLDAEPATRVRTGRLREAPGLFDAVPFTPSQGVCGSNGNGVMSGKNMFSPFANSFARGPGVDAKPSLGGVASDGSAGSDLSGGVVPGSPAGGLSGYSPFMGVPWGNTVPNYLSDAPTATHLELPTSPMSPGVMFNPSPSPSGLGAPGSPRALFGGASPNLYGSMGGASVRSAGSLSLPGGYGGAGGAAANMAAADAAVAAAALSPPLPPFYYQAAAAAAAAGGGGASAAGNLSLHAALSQTLLGQHTVSLAAQQQQMQHHLLQASLSAALASGAANPYLQGYPSAVLSAALEPMRSAGGSLSLDGGLQQQASVQAAVLLQQQQQQHVAAQLRRNMSTPAAVAAQLGLSSAAAAASAQLGLGHAGALPLGAHVGRLHVTHSADLTHLDAGLLSSSAGAMGGRGGSKFKARKNSEPKIGPDGQPRLNARQRRTLRRAKERALKGLLEVSQALLQKAEVQVQVPNISHLTALEELAAVEAEKEAAADASGAGGGGAGGGRAAGAAGGATRSQQLAAAAAAVEESVCEIARAAVAAAAAQATGKDTARAAAAAQAAAAQAASAAASAGAVLPPNFVMPEAEEHPSDELPGGLDPLMDCLSTSAPTSPVGSSAGGSNAGSGRSSSSSSTSSSSLPSSGRCSSNGSASSSFAAAAKPPAAGGVGGAKQLPPPVVVPSSAGSPACTPSPSPLPSAAATPGSKPAGTGSQLEGIDIAGLIGQLSLKKDEGMVDDKLIRDLQIIQSLIGALKAPQGSALDAAAAGAAGCPSPLLGGGGSGSVSAAAAAAAARARGPASAATAAKAGGPKRASSYTAGLPH